MAETLKPIETEKEMDELQKHLISAAAFYRTPTPYEKVVDKMKENPYLAFLPFGCLATLGVMCAGLWSFKSSPGKKSQVMMRLRLVTQGLTLAALCMAMGMEVKKNN